ncbi:MAG TPA: AAA domain-containing protein [Streptosporangiaceae bacterium]|nr:AAA domain-containing protein [Streptosporangiaceae bacterium]
MTPVGRLAEQAVRGVLADLGSGCHRGVVVDSPPGAGKSALVVRAAADLAAAGERAMIVAQTNEQVDDLTDRLAGAQPGLPIGRLCAQDYLPPPRVTEHAQVSVASRVADLAGCLVTLGTAAKWAVLADDVSWPWAIVDEAYQMRSDLLLRIAGRFERALFVGDPGQLDPFSTVDIDRWVGLTWDPMQSAVAVLLRHNPDIPVHRLPVSWRLPEPAAVVVADAFYPFGGFQAGTGPGDRRLELSTRALREDPADEAVAAAAASGWALYELPPRHTLRTDAEAASACGALATRILQRGCVSYSERNPAGTPVTASRIAIGTAHRDQVKAVRAGLGGALADVTVDTANRLQGREFDVAIVLHPLSGRRDATAFHLEAGRLCVLTSRHRHACIVVARAGIPELLDAHPSTEPVHLNVPAKFPDGWEANQAVMAHLAPWRVRAS